jgi:hypothetical protein
VTEDSLSEQYPALDPLFRALTAEAAPAELAGQEAAAAMFRANRTVPVTQPATLSPAQPAAQDEKARRKSRLLRHRLRRHRRYVPSLGMAAAGAAVIAGAVTGGAYAAVLPAPIQHIAHKVLARIGVPDSHASPSRSPQAAQPSPVTPSQQPGPLQSHNPGQPGPSPLAPVSLTAARAQIPAGGQDILSGLLMPGGHPRGGVRLDLLERPAGSQGWRPAGTAVTSSDGAATFSVRHLTSDTSFRLSGPGAALSAPVLVEVVPHVTISVASGTGPQTDTVDVSVRYADPGDAVDLQIFVNGAWRDLARQRLDHAHRAAFSVAAGVGQSYRVLLPATSAHASAVSGQVTVPWASL